MPASSLLHFARRNARRVGWVLIPAAALALYLSCCKSLWKFNPLFDENSPKNYDQTFYIGSAEQLATRSQDMMPRSRMPLYPWIMHFFRDATKTDPELLNVYLRLNVTISVLCLAAVFWLLRRALGVPFAVLTTLAVAYRVFVFKAVLVQPELLFYTLYFALFVLMIRQLRAPSWRLAVGGGLLAGLAHLTKGSALPMIGAFVVFAMAKEISLWRARKAAGESPRPSRLLRPVVFGAAFFAVTGVYLRNSLREYGSALYDPNTRYYFWAESPREMLAMQHLGLAIWKPRFDKDDLDSPLVMEFLPKWAADPVIRAEIVQRASQGESVILEGRYDVLPGFRNWIATHSLRDAWSRLYTGFLGDPSEEKERRRRVAENRNRTLVFVPSVGTGDSLVGHNRDHPNGYWEYLRFVFGAAALTLLLACIFEWPKVRRAVAKEWPVILFALSSIMVAGMCYAWWGHISIRNRYFLTLYLPLMFCFGTIIRFACRHVPLQMRIAWHRRRIKLGPFRLFIIAYAIFTADDLNDPLNRGHLPNPRELERQLVQ